MLFLIFQLLVSINPIQDGPFQGFSRMAAATRPLLPKMSSTYLAMAKLWYSYTLPKKDPKNVLIT